MPTETSSSGPRSPLQWLAASALAAALALAAGCEHEAPPDTFRRVVEIKDVPDDILKAAKKALPDVKFQDAFKNLRTADKSRHSYEVRGRNARGRIREVRVSTDGQILEME